MGAKLGFEYDDTTIKTIKCECGNGTVTVYEDEYSSIKPPYRKYTETSHKINCDNTNCPSFKLYLD